MVFVLTAVPVCSILRRREYIHISEARSLCRSYGGRFILVAHLIPIDPFSPVSPSLFHSLSLEEVEFKGGSGDPLIELDEDGDLLLPRRTDQAHLSFSVTLHHCITSTLRDVGLQVWKAELVLSDFVLHKMCTTSQLDGIVALELGAGTGLLGILLARVAKTVFLTDYGDQILVNCVQNVKLNSQLFDPQAMVNVRELNWMSEWPAQDSHGDCRPPEKFSWSSVDFEQVKRASVIFAADVIYSDDLTIALFTMLKRLMSFGCEKVLYLCLEKRYNFSLDDLDVVANGYSCFRSYVKDASEKDEDEKSFVGKRVDVTQIPGYVKGYDRGEDVELWEIRYLHRPPPID